MTPRLLQALAYAEAGIPVFPCVPGGKKPAIAGGFHSATTDPDIIRGWFRDIGDCNIGVCPEDAGLCVIDVDLPDIPPDLDCPTTRTIGTPNGGLHLYYRGSLPASASKLAPHVDTRGRSSYVLVPPSIVGGKPYKVVNNAPIAPLPAWVSERVRTRELPRLTAPENVELDQPWMVDLARAELRSLVAAGDVAREGEGGDDRTYRLFTRLYEIGLSMDGALDAIGEWNAHCSPPWDDNELQIIAEHAWQYKQNEAGSKALPDPASWNTNQYAPPPEPEPDPEFPKFETMREIAAQPYTAPEWVWEGRIMANRGTLITGDGGAGKTTLMENLAPHVASGTRLWGAEVRQMPVFMLVGEDEKHEVVNNMKLVCRDHGIDEKVVDERIKVLSTETSEIPGGHVLARITDDGKVTDTPFMRSIASQLCRGCLFIIDPRLEFFQFDRNSDDAARALGTKWVRTLYRAGVTVIITEHPSTAGMQRGDHFGGSRQMKSSFTTLAGLTASEWQGGSRSMVLNFVRVKYAREHKIDLVRGESPAFIERGGARHTIGEEERVIYAFVYQRLEAGLEVTATNHGDYGPKGIAKALQMAGHVTIDEELVKETLATLRLRGYIARDGVKILRSTTCPGSELPDEF